MKILFRPHRQLLADAMKECIEINSMKDIVNKLNEFPYGERVKLKQMNIEPYGYDDRIGWQTYMVTVNGNAVGFTNGEISRE